LDGKCFIEHQRGAEVNKRDDLSVAVQMLACWVCRVHWHHEPFLNQENGTIHKRYLVLQEYMHRDPLLDAAAAAAADDDDDENNHLGIVRGSGLVEGRTTQLLHLIKP
jgi:hypothetical protein